MSRRGLTPLLLVASLASLLLHGACGCDDPAGTRPGRDGDPHGGFFGAGGAAGSDGAGAGGAGGSSNGEGGRGETGWGGTAQPAGCSGPVATSELCLPGGLCWMTPWPSPAPLRAIHGLRPDDVWAVGDGGVAVHFDGARWWVTPTGTTAALRAVQVFGDGQVVALGDGGVLRWDGCAWNEVATPALEGPTSLYCSAPDELFVLDASGVRQLHRGSWSSPEPLGLEGGLLGGSGATDVWAVGRGPVAHHFDGAGWAEVPFAPDHPRRSLGALHVPGPGAAWVVGNDLAVAGVVLHWDGTSWTPEPVDSRPLIAISGTGAGLYAVDVQGAVYTRNAAQWVRLPGRAGILELTAALVLGPGSGFATLAQAGLASWAGPGWNQLRAPPEGWGPIFAGAPDDLWLGGGSPLEILHWEGEEWRAVPRRDSLSDDNWGYGAGWADASGAAFLTQHQQIWRLDQGIWWKDLTLAQDVALQALWGSSSADLWAAGCAGSLGILARRDAVGWLVDELPDGPCLSALAGTGTGDVWAVGSDGPEGVATRGRVLHFDGEAWRELEVDLPPLSGAAALGPEHLWVVGRNEAIELRGLTWTRHELRTEYLSGVWAPAPDDVWVEAWNAVFHWDGSSFTEVLRLDEGGVVSIGGLPTGEGWLSLTEGRVLHRPAP